METEEIRDLKSDLHRARAILFNSIEELRLDPLDTQAAKKIISLQENVRLAKKRVLEAQEAILNSNH